jgi:hypothetical protein
MDSNRVRHQPRRRGSAGRAILAGVGVAVAGSAVWGLVAYLVRYQFSLLAVVIGLAVGTVMAWVRPGDRSLAVTGAIVSVAGCALGSLAAEILIALSHSIPVTVLLGDFGRIVRAYPSTVGWLGFLFWVLAACVGFRVLAGPGGWRRGWETSVQEVAAAGADLAGPADTGAS